MGLGDGKAKKEALDIKEELGFMYDAITSLGDKLVSSFEDAVDGAGELGNAMDVVSKTFQRGIAADLKQSVKNTDALIDLFAKLSRDAITQKDIAKEQEKIDSNRIRLQIKRQALGNNITKQQKEFFVLQEGELGKQQSILKTITTKNDALQKQKGLFQLIQENAGGIADKLDKSGTLSKALNGNLLKTLTPLRIFELVVVGIVNAFLDIDKTTEKVAQNLGIGFSEAGNMMGEFSQIAKDSNNIFVTTKGIAESQIQLSAAFGTNAMFSAEMLQTQTELTHQLKLSEGTSAEIAKLGLLTGKTSKEIAANVMGQSVAMNAANGTAITEKAILEEVAKLSSSIQLSMANNPIALAEAVQTAKQFGMELSAVDGIAGSLLNFESSIGAELEAELLLGKDINLEKARQFALNNDLAGVAEEIAKQAGSAAEFTAMNRIQQEALAKAVGMSREDLAKSLQSREVLAKLGGQDADMQAAYNRLKKEGLSQEQIAVELGDKQLAQSLHSEGVQSQFTASVAKMKELFVQVAAALIPIVTPIAAVVGFMANLISKSMGFLKVLGSIAAVMKVIKFIGNDVYRNQVLTNVASKLGLITETEKGIVESRNALTGNSILRIKKMKALYDQNSLATILKEKAIKTYNLGMEKASIVYNKVKLGLENAILAVSEGNYLLTLKENIATKLSNVFLGIKSAITTGIAVTSKINLGTEIALKASQAGAIVMLGARLAIQTAIAAAALVGVSASTLGIGTIVALAAAAGGIAYLMSVSKGNDVMSAGSNMSGYGSRTLMGPEGAIALNNKDTVIAGTDLFKKGDDVVSKPAGSVNMVQDNSKMEKLLERALNRPDPVIEMSGDRLGTAVGKYAYSIQ